MATNSVIKYHKRRVVILIICSQITHPVGSTCVGIAGVRRISKWILFVWTVSINIVFDGGIGVAAEVRGGRGGVYKMKRYFIACKLGKGDIVRMMKKF
jgi:hypothetical protein